MTDPKQVCALYQSGLSASQVGKRLGIAHTSVLYWLKKSVVARRSKSDALKAVIATGGMRLPRHSRSSHYKWKGGRILQKGYVFVLCKDHPRAPAHGYMGEHVLVAERALGRYLNPGEVAHHVNGDKLDNRPSNIEVMTRAEHVRHHRPRLITKTTKAPAA